MKKLILPIVLIFLIVAGYGLYSYNKGPRNLENEKSELMITASGLVTAFEGDETAANGLYLDKVVEVSGTILELASDGSNNVVLDAGNPMSTVICELGDQTSQNNLKVGDQVKIKGQCTGYLMDVILVKAVIVE